MTMLMNRLLTVMHIQQPTDVENPQRVMASKTGCRWLGSEHDPRWRTRITGIRSESHYQVINGDHPHWALKYNPRLNLPIRVKSASGCTALGLVLTDLYPIKIACSCGIPNGLSSEYCGIPKILPTYSNIIIQNCLQLFIFVLWILPQIAAKNCVFCRILWTKQVGSVGLGIAGWLAFARAGSVLGHLPMSKHTDFADAWCCL